MTLQGEGIADLAIGQLPGEGAPVLPPQPATYRFATHTFVTAADDVPAHTPVSGRLLSDFTLRREIAAGEAGRWGALVHVTADSEVVLANTDRGLDALLATYADGRPVTVKVGTVIDGTLPFYDSLQPVITAIAGTFSADLDGLHLRLSDPGLLLQEEIQTQFYDGTGGRQGGADLMGRTKPYAIGKCDNVLAQLLDPAQLIYQVSTRALDFPFAVYDAGVQIPTPSAVVSYDALVAIDVDPGTAAICLAAGCFKLGTQPFGQVTADIRTAPIDVPKTTAALIDTILEEAGVPATGRSITSISDANNNEAGFFLPAGSNLPIEEVVTALAAGDGAVLTTDRNGFYQLLWLDANRLTEAPAFNFDDNSLIVLERPPLPYGVPWSSWVIGQSRNWTVQNASELAIAVPAARRQFLEQEFRQVHTENPDVAQRHLTARQTDLIPTYFAQPLAGSMLVADSTPNPALRFGNRMAAWYAIDRALYRIVIKTVLCQAEIGDIVTITSAHWGLDGGFTGIVVAIADDLEAAETELTLFG